MANRTGTKGGRPESEYQMFRVRKDAHRLAKQAASAAGVSLEQFASDAIEAAAAKVLNRKATK